MFFKKVIGSPPNWHVHISWEGDFFSLKNLSPSYIYHWLFGSSPNIVPEIECVKKWTSYPFKSLQLTSQKVWEELFKQQELYIDGPIYSPWCQLSRIYYLLYLWCLYIVSPKALNSPYANVNSWLNLSTKIPRFLYNSSC